MITLFIIGMIILVFKMVGLAIRATWGIAKALLFVVFLPVILIGIFISGLVSVAIPILVIALIVAIVKSAASS